MFEFERTFGCLERTFGRFEHTFELEHTFEFERTFERFERTYQVLPINGHSTCFKAQPPAQKWPRLKPARAQDGKRQ